MKALLVFLSLLFPILSFAEESEMKDGGQDGNGGDVVVCPGVSVELLDFYEARTLRGIQVEPTSEQDYMVVLDNLLKVYETSSPGMVKRLRTDLATFQSEAIFLSGVVLTDIPDSKHVALPVGCSIQQIAIQRAPTYPEDRRFTVNADLWNQLSALDKAGLVLHELLYKQALEDDITHSMDIRYLNAMLFSKLYLKLTEKARFQLLNNSRQRIFDFHRPELKGVALVGRADGNTYLNAKFDESGAFSELSFGAPQPHLFFFAFSNGLELEFAGGGHIDFENGTPTLHPARPRDLFYRPLGKVIKFSEGLEGGRIRSISSVELMGMGAAVKFETEGVSYEGEYVNLPTEKFLRFISQTATPADFEVGSEFTYALRPSQSLNEFFPESAGEWILPAGGTAIYKGDHYPMVSASAGTVWRHRNGEIRVPSEGGVYVDKKGNPMTGIHFNYEGKWKLPFGMDFDTNAARGIFRLEEDFSFEHGEVVTPLAYSNSQVNLAFRMVYPYDGGKVGKVTMLKYLSEGGTASVQGNVVKLRSGERTGISLYPNGAIASIELIQPLKLKSASGKEKLYKGSSKKPISVDLDLAGLVIE